jgi:hypothetical protein
VLAFLKPPNVAGAAVFFVISHLIAAWLFVMEDLVESVPEFVLTGIPVAAFNLLAVVIPLHLAARIVGVRIHALSTMVMAAYISSVFTVLVAAGVKAMWTGLILGAPNIGRALHDAIYADPRLDLRIQRTSDVLQSAFGAQFFALFALSNLIWLYSVGWLAVASSVIRDMWRISGPRALAILILCTMILAFVVGFVGVVAWIGGS